MADDVSSFVSDGIDDAPSDMGEPNVEALSDCGGFLKPAEGSSGESLLEGWA